ncbi:MAG: hypothetical protein R3212_02715 [Xanthomonadales bacterium]|nr:hypothetical protein [Xanthomonadales bacterium]
MEILSAEIGSAALPTLDGLSVTGDQLELMFADDLSAEEMNTLHSVFAAHKGFVPLHQKDEYTKGLLQKRTRYAVTDGAGNLSVPFDETICTYSGKDLVSVTVNQYNDAGAIVQTKTTNYYSDKQGNDLTMVTEAA